MKALIPLMLLLAVLGIPTSGFAQAGGQPVHVTGYVLFDGAAAAVKGLKWSSTAVPCPGAAPGCQFCQYHLSLSLQIPSGHVVTAYQWRPVQAGITGDEPPIQTLVIEGLGQGASAVGDAYAAAVYQATCAITVVPFGDQTKTYHLTITGTSAVIGGALNFGVVPAGGYPYWASFYPTGGYVTDPTNGASLQRRTDALPQHDDNNLTEPYHLQYFGFDPRKGVPVNCQAPQCTIMVSLDGQGTNTGQSYAWSINGSDNKPSTALAVTMATPPSNSFSATAVGPGSTTVSLMITETFKNANGSSAPVSVSDDTTSVPFGGPNGGFYPNKINCHEPTTTVAIFSPVKWYPSDFLSVDGQGNPVTANMTFGLAAGLWEIQVLSQLGVKMPGVWVQERFTSNPSHIQVHANGAPTWSTAGIEDSSHLGNFYLDRLFWDLPAAQLPGAVVTAVQQYWAATQSTISGGLLVGTWTMTFTLPSSPGLGTVTHTN